MEPRPGLKRRRGRPPTDGLPRRIGVRALALCLPLVLAACAGSHTVRGLDHSILGPGPNGGYKVGQPYAINGRWYYPAEDRAYDRTGLASWYGREFRGRRTANGEVFDHHRFTAAHPTLPMPSLVRVTNLRNGRAVIVRVNDRGPFVPGRIIDVSQAAAVALGFKQDGLTRVRVQYVGRADRGAVPIAAAGSTVGERERLAMAGNGEGLAGSAGSQ